MPVFAGLSTGRVRITVQGKHLEVTEAINGYIDEKIGHAVQPFEEALRVREVTLTVPHVCCRCRTVMDSFGGIVGIPLRNRVVILLSSAIHQLRN